MAECIMVQGTMSGVGKSLMVTALCRIFAEEGLRCAPFKSQNMALNSYVTPNGLELGRAQAVQAEAAGTACDVRMNPILLKPTSDTGSQLIVMGEVRGVYQAKEYFRMKKSLIPVIREAYHSLAEENDIIVIEGAGSPAEINLRSDDIVNMGLAELVGAPVILTGDIDRGGVFAQLYGTVALLRQKERERVVGTVINKFRGDLTLLAPGLRQLEELTGKPVLGVVPWTDIDIDDEDSLAPRLYRRTDRRALDIAVIRLPHISNFTDFAPLESHPDVGLRYVREAAELQTSEQRMPDLIILPGTKNTMGDIFWLRESGIAEAILAHHRQGVPVLGICGGYQMMGRRLADPAGIEEGGSCKGLGLLPAETVFTSEKTRTRRHAECCAGPFEGAGMEGYEIHMGRTTILAEPAAGKEAAGSDAHTGNVRAFCRFADGQEDGMMQDGVFGTYLHGLFDSGELVDCLIGYLAERKGIMITRTKTEPRALFRERQYERLADLVRRSLDMQAIRAAMRDYAERKTPG